MQGFLLLQLFFFPFRRKMKVRQGEGNKLSSSVLEGRLRRNLIFSFDFASLHARKPCQKLKHWTFEKLDNVFCIFVLAFTVQFFFLQVRSFLPFNCVGSEREEIKGRQRGNKDIEVFVLSLPHPSDPWRTKRKGRGGKIGKKNSPRRKGESLFSSFSSSARIFLRSSFSGGERGGRRRGSSFPPPPPKK